MTSYTIKIKYVKDKVAKIKLRRGRDVGVSDMKGYMEVGGV